MKALSRLCAMLFNGHSGISSHAWRQLLTTLGLSGWLYLIAFGTHTTCAFQSASASPLRESSPKASWKASALHSNSSAKAISPARHKPGMLFVWGPVNRKIKRYFPEGPGDDSSRNLLSAHMRVSILR